VSILKSEGRLTLTQGLTGVMPLLLGQKNDFIIRGIAMKIIPLAAAIIFGITLTFSYSALAEKTTTLKGENVVGVDSNRNKQINEKSIENGEDALIAHKVTSAQILDKDSFLGPDGNTYLPINSIKALRALDLNKDNIISADELQKAEASFVTARFLEGTTDIIPERSLASEFLSIRLPVKPGDPAVVNLDGNNTLILQEVHIDQ